jgi:hypothetical protein
MGTFENEENRHLIYEELDKLEALGAIIRR